MNLRAVRRSSLLRTLACTALSLGLSAALSAAPAAGDPGQPSVKVSPVAQVPPAAIEIHHGQFESGGKPVEDFYCVPLGPGAHPAVILLHGAVPRGAGNEGFAEMCRKLAAAGYYAMFIEYYSQAGPALPGQRQVSGKGFAAWVDGNFPAWMREIVSGIDLLNENPRIERDRIALMGFSLGGFLALAVGASEGGRVAAIVEYYGGMNNSYTSMAANMPPTLILHGDADMTVPVRYARELDALLTKYNRPHEMKIYPGAWHGLDPASRDDAWRRSMNFLLRYLGR
jgi:carboxymethylenebutenolidase